MKRALKMHLISGNDLKTFLLHRTAFLCVSRFLRLASFGTVNALMIVISVTFQPLFSVIPEIWCKVVCRCHFLFLKYTEGLVSFTKNEK